MTLSPVVKAGILLTIGLILATAGLLCYGLFPSLLRSQIEQRLKLSEDSEMYEQWREPTIPIYLNIYFFNITNPLEVANSSTPILEEVGPYSFRETRTKENITWHDNGTVSYILVKRYYFQPDLTNGSLDDTIITLNVPMISIAAIAVKMNDSTFTTMLTDVFILTNSTVIMARSARQLIFEGYSDILLSAVNQIFPSKMPHDKFAWFYKKNGTSDGHTYTVYTGKDGIHNYGYIDNWNGQNNLSIWDSPCSEIKGTMGDMWPPFRKSRYEELHLFVPDICRTLSLTYVSDQKVKGVEAYRYMMDHSTFDNGKFNPSNKCYCSGKCLPAGGLDVSMCQKGAPIVMSAPHFLYGDAPYTQNIIGLKPNPKQHQFYIDIQPEMGVPLTVSAKMQINVILERIPDIEQFKNVPGRIYFPIIWFSQNAEINDQIAERLLLVTQDVPYYVTVGSILLVVLGGILFILAIVFSIRVMQSKRKNRGVYSAVKVIKT